MDQNNMGRRRRAGRASTASAGRRARRPAAARRPKLTRAQRKAQRIRQRAKAQGTVATARSQGAAIRAQTGARGGGLANVAGVAGDLFDTVSGAVGGSRSAMVDVPEPPIDPEQGGKFPWLWVAVGGGVVAVLLATNKPKKGRR